MVIHILLPVSTKERVAENLCEYEMCEWVKIRTSYEVLDSVLLKEQVTAFRPPSFCFSQHKTLCLLRAGCVQLVPAHV